MRTANQLQTKDSKMAKKYDAIAIKFAKNLVTLNNSKNEAIDPAQVYYFATMMAGYWTAIYTYKRNEQEVNPRFDSERFEDFIQDIVDGKRDENGKLIKSRKAA
jgi:2',3'-cyclic-nucleotide 2'-phosphodiesterase (5'-nucleotidase family)